MRPIHLLTAAALLTLASHATAQLGADGATASFKGSLPPKPTSPLSADQEAALEKDLAAATADFAPLKSHPRAADIHIFLKAVRYALDFQEWYDKKPEDSLKKATALLTEARARTTALKKGDTPWLTGTGQKVLGFYSAIDGSPQPYGVEIPEGLQYGANQRPVPMWIWLHGRGDTATDLPFIYAKLTAKKPGQFTPAGTIIIHPFGRYCNGWKSAGETDVFECRDDAIQRFNIDHDRVALAGFSMGGAGAWHIGAHFADQFAAVHTGAGFVDVQRYQKLTPDKMPPAYEQTLWGVYDVPAYVRNFKNVPLLSYSGENDTQRDSADYMTEVLAREGMQRPHLIGPGMGHKYHPEVIKEVQAWIEKAVAKGRDPQPKTVTLQTRTLQYSKMFWVQLLAQEKGWHDTRIDAQLQPIGTLHVTTKNVRTLAFTLPSTTDAPVTRIQLDGQDLPYTLPEPAPLFAKAFAADPTATMALAIEHGRDNPGPPQAVFTKDPATGKWTPQASDHISHPSHTSHPANTPPSQAPPALPLQKRPGQSGPIEERLMHPFIVVLPDRDCASPEITAWVNAESQHFLTRWRSLMRGDPRVKKASEVTREDMQNYTLVLWGDPRSNRLIAEILILEGHLSPALNLAWSAQLTLGTHTLDGTTHVPVLTRPSPLDPTGRAMYILNSGLTFRESHDRTNSLQNPKLPDWALLDIIAQPPNADPPGKVIAADFFGPAWEFVEGKK